MSIFGDKILSFHFPNFMSLLIAFFYLHKKLQLIFFVAIFCQNILYKIQCLPYSGFLYFYTHTLFCHINLVINCLSQINFFYGKYFFLRIKTLVISIFFPEFFWLQDSYYYNVHVTNFVSRKIFVSKIFLQTIFSHYFHYVYCHYCCRDYK